MSVPRSRSRYRRFSRDEPDFDPHKFIAELDRDQLDRSRRPEEDPDECLDYPRKDMYPEGQRRSPFFPVDRPFGHQRHPNKEEFYHRRPSPHRDPMGYEDRRLSPPRDGGGDRPRGGFREHPQSFESRGRSPCSPPRLTRERLPATPRSHLDHQERDPGTGWRREERGRSRGRFRDLSPGARSDGQRGGAGWERGRRNTQGPNGDRRREETHEERNPAFKRQRREMDDGYRNEEDFGEPRYLVDAPRKKFEGDTRESLPRGDARHSGPLVIDHDHGKARGREPARWEKLDNHRDLEPDFDQQRSPRPMGSSQERFRTSDSRMEHREDTRGRHFQGNWRGKSYENRRSLTPQERPNPTRYQDGPMNHRGRGGPRPPRGRGGRGQGGRAGPRNQARFQQSSQGGYKDVPREEQRPGYRPFRDETPVKEEVDWAEETGAQQWKRDMPGSQVRHPPLVDLDPKMPRQRQQGWKDPEADDVTVVTEETLTIKVDMSRPAKLNSSLSYALDRQLSLDLVNVGRQRLDFLPMLEHSGTYRETAMHTGTFAQEIITLVHHVKEQYFRDGGLTLNERFSAPHEGSFSETETEEMTLDERFSSNRGFSLQTSSLLDEEEPLISRLGPLLPVRGPGDLRHDLERRRQERLEGVKVTIAGNSLSQRPLDPDSEPGLDYSDKDEMDEEGFSTWPRREGGMGPRRGAPFRPNNGFQRRNNRFGPRLGPMRRQNIRSNPAASAGPDW